MMSVKGVVVDSHKMELSSSENGKNREMDQESTGSSDDMESPRSVVANKNNNNNNKMRKWPDYNKNNKSNVSMCVHSQILRIREEDSHIGEDNINNGDHNNYYGSNRVVGSVECHDDDHKYITSNNRYHDDHDHVDIWIISHRPILPASPLSGKPHIKSQFH